MKNEPSGTHMPYTILRKAFGLSQVGCILGCFTIEFSICAKNRKEIGLWT
jgi:hypothetical protein